VLLVDGLSLVVTFQDVGEDREADLHLRGWILEVLPVAARVAGQSWRTSMNTGIRRVVLVWNSPTAGDSATSFGHSSARAMSSSYCASTVNVSVPSSTLILGLALRL
jgi:hypothetical protein